MTKEIKILLKTIKRRADLMVNDSGQIVRDVEYIMEQEKKRKNKLIKKYEQRD